MRQLSLDGLRAFVCVVDSGGYQKAGELLGRSQPAISLQIKRLEQQLNKRLFKKVGQRHVINRDGEQLYVSAKKMLALNDDIFRQYSPAAVRGRLRLGIPSEFAATLLPSIIGDFSKLYPEVTLEVTSALSKSLLDSDNNEEFDLLLALVNPEQNIEGELVLNDDLIWVGSKQHPIDSAGLSLVLAPDGCVYRSRVIDRLKQQTVQWRISYTNADLGGITAAINQGMGVSALARTSKPPQLEQIKHAQLPELGKIKICLINKGVRHPQATQKLAEFISLRLRAL